jgi:hypothetical protein
MMPCRVAKAALVSVLCVLASIAAYVVWSLATCQVTSIGGLP